MHSSERNALTAEAAVARVLAENHDQLWPDEIKTLGSAMDVFRRLARRI